MLDPNRHYLFLNWPPYLAQWYAHELYRYRHAGIKNMPEYQYDTNANKWELEPVEPIRGSAEAHIIKLNLTKQPDDIPDLKDQNATICIRLLEYNNKKPLLYNYLPHEGQTLLEELVRNRMKGDFLRYLMKIYEGSGRIIKLDTVINAYMEARGIDPNETNLATMKQMYHRCRVMYNRKFKKYENTGNNEDWLSED